jgi:hypothetical protein
MTGRGIYAQGRSESAQPVCVVDAGAVREQLERVVADPLFCNSKRYSNLLRFVTDRSLEGRNGDLKERIIGIEVFGRSPDYDTSLDATVRVTAAEVRKRLALYYKQSGHEQELCIEVPNGSYVAEFRLPEQKPQEPQPAPKGRKLKLWYFGAAFAIVILAFTARYLPRALSPKPVIDQFWSPLLSGSGPLAFYPPFSSFSPPAPSASPPVSAPSGKLFYEFLKDRGQVPVNDVTATSALSFFLRQKGKESIVRNVRGVNLAALRSAPAVFLGSFNNDWVIRLGADLRFRFHRESAFGVRWIEDGTNSQNKNWAVDYAAPYGQVTEDYALISRVLDPSTGQWLILIGGLTGLATSAACEFVTDPNAMASLGAQLPRNWATKNLQVVLAVKLIQGSPGASQVVATHSW